VGGNPAKIIKYRFDEDTIAQLLKLQWWDWSESTIKDAMPLICSEDIAGLLALNRH
jgi:chloramphenicol O-acetyltransferase type B